MLRRISGLSKHQLPVASLFHSNIACYHAFDATQMTDTDLNMYCMQHNLRPDTADRSALVRAVENHKLENTTGPERAILFEKLDKEQRRGRAPSPSLTAKALKDQANATHIFVKSKRTVRHKPRVAPKHIVRDLPMEVVMVAADQRAVCFAFADGTTTVVRLSGRPDLSIPRMVTEALDFLRSSMPGKSYALFQVSASRLSTCVLTAIRQERAPDIEFSFDVPTFFKFFLPYHYTIKLGVAPITGVNAAQQLGVWSPRPASKNDVEAREAELICQAKDFHTVLRLFRDYLNPFPQGPTGGMLGLLTGIWTIVLYQLAETPAYVTKGLSECSGTLYFVNESRSVPFTGSVKYQIAESMAAHLKEVCRPSMHYLILYPEETEGLKMRKLCTKNKLRCDFVDLRKIVPQPMQQTLDKAEKRADIWRPENLWKTWQRELIAEGLQGDAPTMIKRMLTSGLLFKRTVTDQVGDHPEAPNQAATPDVPAFIQTQHADEFVSPAWLRFRTDPERLRREQACADTFADYFLFHVDEREGQLRFATRRNDGPETITTKVEDINLDALAECQCAVFFDARSSLRHLWGRPELHKFISRGGRVWCITFASYLINGKQPVTSDQDLTTAQRLLAHKWLDTTRKLQLLEAYFSKQKELAVRNRQMVYVASMLDSTVTVNELSHTKIHVEVDRVPRARAHLEKRVEALKAELVHFIPEAAREQFDWNNREHLKCLFQGGTIVPGANAVREFVAEVGPPVDPLLALCLAQRAGTLSEKILNKYTNLQALVPNTPVTDPSFFDALVTHIQLRRAANRPLSILVADIHTSGFNVAADHVTEIVVYNPVTGKRVLNFPATTDHLILSANSGMFTEAFMRKHFQNTRVATPTVFYADISTIIAHARKSTIGRQVCLAGRARYTDRTVLGRLMDSAAGLWRDLISVHPGDVGALIGGLVGSETDPFMTQAGPVAALELPGMISYEKKLANSRMADKSEVLSELLHHEGTPEAQQLCELLSLQRMLDNPYLQAGQITRFVDGERMHADLHYLETRTGRFTATKPNVLAIPKDPALRTCFTSRFGAKGFILEIDYSMLEICTMAVLCGDRNMLSDINANIDFHTRNVVVLNPAFTYEELVRKIKVENDEGLKKLRERAKIFSFQRLYGASQSGIVRSTGLSEREVQALLREERQRYPGMRQFTKDFRATVCRLRADIQVPRDLTKSVALYVGEGVIPTGSTFRFEQAPVGGHPQFSSTTLKNYPVQGLAAEIAHVMASKIVRTLKQREYFGGRAYLVNVIHDSFVFDVHEDAAGECFPLMQDILQGVNETFAEMYPDMHWGKIKFRVKSAIGRWWGDMRPVKNAEDIEIAKAMRVSDRDIPVMGE